MLVVRIAVPIVTGNIWLNWSIFLVAMFLLAVLIGTVESVMARFRMTEIPKILATACVLSGLAVLLLVT